MAGDFRKGRDPAAASEVARVPPSERCWTSSWPQPAREGGKRRFRACPLIEISEGWVGATGVVRRAARPAMREPLPGGGGRGRWGQGWDMRGTRKMSGLSTRKTTGPGLNKL